MSGADEEAIRAAVEAAFRARDRAMEESGRPGLKTNVERVELRGSYPETALVVHGPGPDGRSVEMVYELWAPDSYDWENDPGSPLLLVQEYFES